MATQAMKVGASPCPPGGNRNSLNQCAEMPGRPKGAFATKPDATASTPNAAIGATMLHGDSPAWCVSCAATHSVSSAASVVSVSGLAASSALRSTPPRYDPWKVRKRARKM